MNDEKMLLCKMRSLKLNSNTDVDDFLTVTPFHNLDGVNQRDHGGARAQDAEEREHAGVHGLDVDSKVKI